ncbi:hypothetical protein QOZ80_7AG0560100 [Eleusine coracana subsp. coracana]|nr:hypothetical protein QOZ80_7AG0560100 [Eleusine coracana subsp. coracana]
MELQFQNPESHAQQQQQCHDYQVLVVAKETNKPSRARRKCGGAGKFVGVRQRPSGRWVAEIKDTTQKIRMWLGTFETAEEAARAYDEAACLLRGANTRTNFAAGAPVSPPDSPLASRIRALLNHKKLKKNVSQQQPAMTFSPTAYRHGSTGSITAATAATSTSASTITTTSSVSPTSSASSTINFAMSSGGVRTPILPAHNVTEDAYRPYLLSGSEEFQQHYDQSWELNTSLPPTEGRDMASDNACSAMAELEKINLEKGSPASTQVMDRVQDQADFDSLWDLPPICPLSCRSLMY